MEITERRSGYVTILEIRGKLVLGPEGTVPLRRKLDQLAEERVTAVLINMRNVKDVDANGVATLNTEKEKWLKRRAVIKLYCLSTKLDTAIAFKLATNFDVFDDEASAVDSF